MLRKLIGLLCLSALLQSRAAHVVINEIMYHPPDDHDELQYVELFNPGSAPVDLSGWKLSGGVKFTFPAKSVIASEGYVIIAHDPAALQRVHGATVIPLGAFTGRLSHKGEKIELIDASGKLVEKVHFRDSAGWPRGGDGYGSSLERICPETSADDPANWAASHSPAGTRAGGSPGEANSVFSAKPLPVIQNVHWEKLAKPNEPLEITAEVSGTAAVETVTLQYRTIRAARLSAANEIEMTRVPGANGATRYTARVPAQSAGTLVRFVVQAKDKQGAIRLEPASSEPKPAFSACFYGSPQRASIPLLTVLNPEPLRGGGNSKMAPPRKDPKGSGRSAVLYIPPQGEVQLFDFVQVRRRAGGLKVHFLKDEPLADMTAINLLFEGPPRWVLSEHLSYELYRKAGMKIENSGHVRLTVDNRELGYYLLVEQPNKHFLARSGRDGSGNLYKVQWFGNGIVGQHEKKTNLETGHGDIVSLIETLRSKTGAAQWAYISEQFDVDAFANYYAVNMCIENWDGFFNNHFVYHDLKPGGKWDILPWDEDKTWGEYDGGPRDYSWYDMPLITGSSSDHSHRGNGWFGGGGGFDGWWRPPGFLSGPLLSNPQFRQRFEARLRELCLNVFTPEKFGPVIQEMQQKLRPEVELKARLMNQDPSWALRQFDSDIASFNRQLVNRRKYILANLK